MTRYSPMGLELLPRNLQAALRDVTSTKVAVRRSAARDLGRHVPSSSRALVLQQLLQLTQSDPDVEVRAQAILALADGQAHEAEELLVAVAESGAPRVQQVALLALGELAGAENMAVSAVAERATHSELAAIRYQGLVTLRQVHPAGALARIPALLHDGDPEVRWVSLRLLEEITTPDESSKAPPPVEPAVVSTVCSLTNDTSFHVRVTATLLAASWSDPTALGLLAPLLGGRPRLAPEDELTAMDLAGKHQVLETRAELERRAWRWWGSPSTCFAARVALARMGNERARRSLLEDLNSNTPARCARAVDPVGLLGMREGIARLRQLLEHPEAYDTKAIERALQRLEG